ncbi:acyltransferase [Luteitalea sp.]|uniref:acyltransferase family protein n=1 Tax=Luteitalea sp. TaxID=2004800 RepID=UPI0025BEACE6|nr:acyltransferase [Luteitalea sp.]
MAELGAPDGGVATADRAVTLADSPTTRPRAAASTAEAAPYYPQLDALRAVAVIGVLIDHTTDWCRGMGGAGVRVFFVLSGFLITEILLRARDTGHATPGRVLWAFYVRRALRIVPLAYAAVAVVWLLDTRGARDFVWWYLTFTTNVLLVREQWWVPLGHFWSLAVEEQFYLLWPLVVLWTPRPRLGGVLAALVATAAVMRLWFVPEVEGPRWASALTPMVVDALAVGAWLATRPRQPRAWPLPLALLATVVLIALRGTTDALVFATLYQWAWLAGSLALVQASVQGWPGALGRVAAWRPLLTLGRISYGVYVIHWLVPTLFSAAQRFTGVPMTYPDAGLPRLVFVTGLTLLVAIPSYRWFERPLLTLRARVPYAVPSR